MAATREGKNLSERSAGDAPESHHVGLIELFVVFSRLGLSSFGGGVSVWMHRAFVERRRWLGENEFSAALALGRIMPGANVVNLAVLIGQRVRGVPGAVAAVVGLIMGPSLVAIAIAIASRRFAGTIILPALLEGTAAAAVGLLIGMGATSGARIVRLGTKSGSPAAHGMGTMAVMAGMFVLIGMFRFPTVPTVLCLAPFSIVLAFFTGKNSSVGSRND